MERHSFDTRKLGEITLFYAVKDIKRNWDREELLLWTLTNIYDPPVLNNLNQSW